MSKIKIIVTIFLVLCTLAMAQKPKVAVGAVGEEPSGSGALKGLSSQLTKAIVKSGEYTAVDRSEIILTQLGKEFKYQMGGAVEESRIKQLGKQFEVDYLCIVESSNLMGGYMLEAKLVDVETAEIMGMGSDTSSLETRGEFMRVSEKLSKELLSGAGSDGSSQKRSRGASFTDPRDGKKYKTVKIGFQTWMAENLNYEAEGSKCYNDVNTNCKVYGLLYDWETAMKACPSGWHLPSNDEWDLLERDVGEKSGKKLKAKRGWSNNGNGTDESGFSALSGGLGYPDGDFNSVGDCGYWWSAEGRNHSASYWNMGYDDDCAFVNWNDYSKGYLFSVRCVQD